MVERKPGTDSPLLDRGRVRTGDPWPVIRRSYLVILVVVISILVWAGVTSIARGAHAYGKVVVESSKKVVAHKEGGIVREIRVTEGQSVGQGDVLLILDETLAKSAVDSLEEGLARNMAAEARLVAELRGDQVINFPNLLPGSLKEKLAKAIPDQMQSFDARRARFREQMQQAEAKLAQLAPQAASSASDASALEKNLTILTKRADSLEPLVADGLYAKNPYLDLQSTINRVTAELQAKRNEGGRLREALSEAQAARAIVQAQFRQEASERLAEVRGGIASARAQLEAASDALQRTRIVAPVSGQVFNLAVHTVGGVIVSGQPIMNIVPNAERLIMEVHIQPTDVDVVRPGMPCEVRFLPFARRTTPLLRGTLVSLSGDVVGEGGAGEPAGAPRSAAGYYVGRVEVEKSEMQKLGSNQITPGMPVEVLLKAGDRTVLEYLTAPWTDLFSKAMRED